MQETKKGTIEDLEVQKKIALILGTATALVLFGMLLSDPVARTEVLGTEGFSALMLALALANKIRNERIDKQKSN